MAVETEPYPEQKSEPPTKKGEKGKKQRRINIPLLSSFGIALFVHLIIILAVGSYVVYEGIVPARFFESNFVDGNQDSLMEEMPALIEEEPLPQVQSTETEVVQEEGGADAPDFSDLITVPAPTFTPSFSMPTATGNPGLIQGSLTGGSGTGNGTGIGTGKVKLGSLFGSRGLGGAALQGHLYDFKQNNDGDPIGKPDYKTISRAFTDDWDEAVLEDYFKAPTTLSATQIFMPTIEASTAPAAFNVEDEVRPSAWMVHYKGEISPPHSGKFRLVGAADDVLIVRVNGKIVFDGSWSDGYSSADGTEVRKSIGESFGWGKGMLAGKWMTLRAGSTYPIEIALGEVPGGRFMAFLMVQEDGVNYKQNALGYPILPVFQLMPTELPDYQVNQKFGGFEVLEDGLVFGAK